jgi:hypothetical protein
MSTAPIHPDALHYRCIDADYGGTYTRRYRQPSERAFATDTLPAIGTYGCSSCVGVYFELSPTTCFVAHINAAHLPMDYSTITREETLYDLRVVTDVEGGHIRDEVIRKLTIASRCMNRPPLDQIRNILLVCPVLQHPISGATLSGIYVVQGIRDFLGRRDIPVNAESEGFVVSYETGMVQYFPWPEVDEDPPLPDNGRDFVAHTYHGNEPPRWFIDVGELWRPGGGRARAASVGW